MCGPTARVAAGWIGEVDTVVIYMGHHSKFGPVGSGTPVTAKTRLHASTAVDAHSELYVLSQLIPFNTAYRASSTQPVAIIYVSNSHETG